MICLNCKKEYQLKHHYTKEYLAKRKYCSRECYRQGGDSTWLSKGHKSLITTQGSSHHLWKGDKIGYSALHKWITQKLGRPQECWVCGTKEAKRYEWANISHLYKRVLNDWMRLCGVCHYAYDHEKNWVCAGIVDGRKA